MRFLEDVVVGETACLGSHCFTREDILRFAAAFDPQPFHLSDDAAAKTHFGRLSASGWHTAAIFMRLMAAHMAETAAQMRSRGEPVAQMGTSPGFRNMRWIEPVFVDDIVTYHRTCTSKRLLASRPGWGVTTYFLSGTNQHGRRVFEFDSAVFVASRG